jgi:hypothetical protein
VVVVQKLKFLNNSIIKKNGFYGHIGINLIVLLFYLGLGQEKKAIEYQRENPMFAR